MAKKIQPLVQDDISLFKHTISKLKGTTQPLVQDKIHLSAQARKYKDQQKSLNHPLHPKKLAAEFFFSDEYEAQLNQSGPVSYTQKNQPSYLSKQLRRGDFSPEITLDLHGFTKEATKRELAEFLAYCYQSHLYCACIIHGKGQQILKQKVPHYLVQHPKVLAFHQAPQKYGGKHGILLLIDIPDKQMAEY